jgi:hypothetical protein
MSSEQSDRVSSVEVTKEEAMFDRLVQRTQTETEQEYTKRMSRMLQLAVTKARLSSENSAV